MAGSSEFMEEGAPSPDPGSSQSTWDTTENLNRSRLFEGERGVPRTSSLDIVAPRSDFTPLRSPDSRSEKTSQVENLGCRPVRRSSGSGSSLVQEFGRTSGIPVSSPGETKTIVLHKSCYYLPFTSLLPVVRLSGLDMESMLTASLMRAVLS